MNTKLNLAAIKLRDRVQVLSRKAEFVYDDKVEGHEMWDALLAKQQDKRDYAESLRVKHKYNQSFKEKQGAQLAEVQTDDPFFQYLV